jgi:hypothetical protein
MKKLIISLAAAIGFAAVAQAQNLAFSATVASGGFTQIVSPNMSFKLSQLILTSTNNATGVLVDTPTNSLTYVLGAYTNTISYLTNSAYLATNGGYNQFTYTNYYGVVTSLTNATSSSYVLVDVTNTVAQSTNNYPSIAVACTTVPTTINNLNVTFYRGVWFTNTGSSTVTVSVTGIRQ